VLKAIIEISLKPSVNLRQLAKEALSKIPDPVSLLTFSLALLWQIMCGAVLLGFLRRELV
jgi:hypothetical protein